VGTGRGRIQVVLAESPVQFTLKQTIQRIFLRVTDVLLEASYKHTTSRIICNLQVLIVFHRCSVCLRVREQVTDSFIVDFAVTDTDGDCLIKLLSGQSVHLINSSGKDTSVLEDGSASCHRVCLTGTGLSIAQNCTVVTIDDRVDDIMGC